MAANTVRTIPFLRSKFTVLRGLIPRLRCVAPRGGHAVDVPQFYSNVIYGGIDIDYDGALMQNMVTSMHSCHYAAQEEV